MFDIEFGPIIDIFSYIDIKSYYKWNMLSISKTINKTIKKNIILNHKKYDLFKCYGYLKFLIEEKVILNFQLFYTYLYKNKYFTLQKLLLENI